MFFLVVWCTVHSFSIFVMTEKSALWMMSHILLEVVNYKLLHGGIRSVVSPFSANFESSS